MITCTYIPMMFQLFIMLFVGETCVLCSSQNILFLVFITIIYKHTISTTGKDEEPKKTLLFIYFINFICSTVFQYIVALALVFH